jgi:predicted TIM-barrel enzyme
MIELESVFRSSKPVLGMLHVPALPGSPKNTLGLNEILDWVLSIRVERPLILSPS